MYNFVVALVRLYLKIVNKIIYIDRQNIPNGGGFIAAANHQSNWDPPFVGTSLYGKYSIMAKAELFKNKFFAWIITKLGAFPVERGKAANEPIERAISEIEKGKIFIIFPEGTRSKDGKIGRAKSGVTLIASQAKAPVLPVCVKYGEKRHFHRRRIWIAFGEVILPEQIAIDGTDRKALKQASELIMGKISEMMDKMPSEN